MVGFIQSGRFAAAASGPPSSGKVFHFDASILTDADATQLATWTNQGTAGNLTNAIGSGQPRVKTAVLNGLRVVRFNGSSNSMATAAVAAITEPLHVFIVANIDSPSVGIFDGIASGNRACLAVSGANLVMIGTAALGYAQALPTGFHRWRLLFGTTDVMHKDDTQVASGAAGAGSLTGLRVGSLHNGTGFSTVDIAEIIAYSRALSAGEITTVEAYLQAKWGV